MPPVYETLIFLSESESDTVSNSADQVVDGGPLHVVDQPRQDENKGRRVGGGSLLPCRLCKTLGRDERERGGREGEGGRLVTKHAGKLQVRYLC